MMGRSAWMAGSLLGMAMLTSGAAVAQSQPRYGYPQTDARQDDNRYDDEDLTPPARDDQATAPEQSRSDEDFSDVVAADRQREQSGRRPADPSEERDEATPPRAEDEEADALTNACAIAARDEAEREGGYAEIRQMEAPRESRNGFIIDGDVESRSNWRAQDGRLRHFTCAVANGRVEDIYFRRDRVTR